MAEANIGDKIIREFMLEYSLLKGRLIRLESERRKIIFSGPKDVTSVAIDGMPRGSNVRDTFGKMNRLLAIPEEIDYINDLITATDQMLDTIDVRREDKAYSKKLEVFI